jgi:DNA-directed RNA polymerase subunit alpha
VSKPLPWVKYEEISVDRGRFVVSPLNRGMGVTLGNSMRRILLSSLSGYGITSVKIDGVKHEFSAIPNVVEDVLDVVTNIKNIVFKGTFEEPKKLVLEVGKAGVVTAKHIKLDSEIEIVNKDCYISEVSDGGKLRIEILVEKGIGFKTAEYSNKDQSEIDVIDVDTAFSPITKVNHEVENIRVGKALDYDRLILDVWTNGSVCPEDAVKEAADILMDRYMLFKTINVKPEEEKDEKSAEQSREEIAESALSMSVDDLELSARSSNCLKRAGIETVQQLVDKNMSELIEIKNFGKKSADEINEKLAQYNLALKEF